MKIELEVYLQCETEDLDKTEGVAIRREGNPFSL